MAITYDVKYAVSGLNKKGEGLIQIIVRFSPNIRKKVSTGIYVLPEQWDEKHRCVRKHDSAIQYNLKISGKIDAIKRFESELDMRNQPFTLKQLETFLVGEQAISIFNEFYRTQLNKCNLADSSRRDQNQTLEILSAYNSRIMFNDLNSTLILDFDNYLRNEGYAQSTILKHHKNIKKYIKLAITQSIFTGDVSRHPYTGIKFTRPKGSRDFLTWEEILKIKNSVYPTDRQRKIADLFVFQCCTGLRDSDLRRVTNEMFDGENLVIKPLKTINSSGIKVVLPLKQLFEGLPYELFTKYNGILSVPANQDYNSELKVVASNAEITKHLTTHVGRHTFLTQIALVTGNVFTVMKLGGITKIDTAQIYIHIAEDSINAADMLTGIAWPSANL